MTNMNEQSKKELIRLANNGDPEAMYVLGARCEDEGDLDNADSLYLFAGKYGVLEALNSFGRLRLRCGDEFNAVCAWFCAAKKGCVNSQYNLGIYFLNRSEYDMCGHYLDIAADNGKLEAIYALGKLFFRTGRFEDAEKNIRFAVEVSGNIDAMNDLGVLLQRKGDIKGAREMYTKAVVRGSEEAARNLKNLNE